MKINKKNKLKTTTKIAIITTIKETKIIQLRHNSGKPK